jgi:two-component system chemotaxis response regulator CheB
MLDDGTSGLEAIMKAGGIAVIQDPNEAEFPEMPVSAIRNLAINHVAPISEMGNLIKKLINEPFEENNPVPKHILREAEIAERYITGIDNIENVEKIGKQIPISCPDCGGALWQISESNIPRFRCHVGHAFNGAGLLRSHSKAMEETLWVSLRMLEERLHMLVTMYENQTKSNNHKLAATIPERMEEVKVHISRIRQILTSNEVYKGFSESL